MGFPLVFGALPALAVDGWAEVHPGLQFVEVVRPGPIRVFLADIDTCAPGVHFRATSPLDGTSSRVTSDFAGAVGVALATNGDFFDHDFGMNVGESVDWRGWASVSAAVDTATSGNFAVGPDRIEMIPDYQVLPGPEAWMQQVVSGRWTLLEDGVANYGIADGGFVCSPGLRHPRTVVGQSADGRHVYVMVADGRGFGGSIGITCDEVIDLMLELGASDAMGLDGGGSSTFVLDGAVRNHPTDGHERSVLNHFGVFADGVGSAPHCGELAAAPTGGPLPGPVVPLGSPGGFEPVVPVRLFDTRSDASGLIGASLDASGRVLGGTSVGFAGFGLPADTIGVWVNLATTESDAAGFVTVYPGGQPLPVASNLNHAAGETVSNSMAMALPAGTLQFFTSATTHLVADLQGRLVPGGAGWSPVTPVRLLDTRTTGARLVAGVPMVIAGPLPAPSVGALLDVAVVGPSEAGFLTVYPCGSAVPLASNLNFDAGETAAAAASVGWSGEGICAMSNVDADLVVDLTGTWDAGQGLQVQPVQPLRLLDTRDGTGGWKGRVKPGQVIALGLSALAGWPADGRAAVVNVTVTEPSSPGFVTVYPCAATAPTTSNLNYAPGQTVANLATSAVSDAGELCLSAFGATHLVVDLMAVGVGPAVDLSDPPVVSEAEPPAGSPAPGCATAPASGGWALLLGLLIRRRANCLPYYSLSPASGERVGVRGVATLSAMSNVCK